MKAYMKLSILLLVLGLGVMSGPVHANGYRVATGDHYPPFTGRQLHGGGFATEIIRAVYAHMDLPFELSWLPWKEGYNDMLEGYFVGVFPYGRNPDRDKAVLYSDPLWVFKGSRLFSRTDNKTNFNHLNRVGGAFLCLGSHHPRQWLKDYLAKGTFILFEAPKVNDCFKMLAAKRVDAVAIDELTGISITKQRKLKRSNFKISKKYFGRPSSRHFLVAKSGRKSQTFLERFNKSLAAVRASGAYAKILRRYK